MSNINVFKCLKNNMSQFLRSEKNKREIFKACKIEQWFLRERFYHGYNVTVFFKCSKEIFLFISKV